MIYEIASVHIRCGFAAHTLKAIVILDTKWIGEHKDTVQLEFLHIDRAYRKQGIGRILFMKAVEEANNLKAKRLYISSCENKNTVEFYKHMGCSITSDVDAELFRLEPNDIHMDYML
ncbi:MAG: GNAT family N-acetyltransferase [Bacteroidetes bacterium]|nr:GNAT family N-acetyltransferase [Bacteroidota bacterium]